MAAVDVRCDGSRSDGWTCTVTVRDGGRDSSTHRVHVSPGDLARLAPDASDAAALVHESFQFLLERESARMILKGFDLGDIGRYYPEYEHDIAGRMRGLS